MTNSERSRRFKEVLARLAASPGAWIDPRGGRFWIVFLFLAYTLVGFLLLPYIVREQIVATVATQLAREATVERVRVNPFVLSMEITGFRVQDTDGSALIGFDRLYGNFQLSSLFRWALTFREVRVEAFNARVVRYADGRTNLGDLISALPREPMPSESQRALPRFLIFDLGFEASGVEVRDESTAPPFEVSVVPVNLAVQNLSSLAEREAAYQFDASSSDGVTMDSTGRVRLEPLKVSGRFATEGPYPSVAHRYFQSLLNFTIGAGQTELDLDFKVSTGHTGGPEAVIDNLQFAIRDLALIAPTDSPFLGLVALEVGDGYLEWPGRRAGAASLLVNTLQVDTGRDPKGVPGFLQWVRLPQEARQSPQAESKSGAVPLSDWDLALDKVRVEDSGVRFVDESLRLPGQIEVVRLDARVSEISNKPGQRFPLELEMEVVPGGRVDLSGDIAVLPEIAASVNLGVKGLALAIAQPFISDVARLRIDSGKLGMSADITMQGPTELDVKGSLVFDDVGISDEARQEHLAGWQSVAIDRFEYSRGANALVVSEVAVSQPYLDLLITENQSTNFHQLVVAADPQDHGAGFEEETPDASIEASNAAPLAITVGRIEIEEGALDFQDLSLPFPFAARIFDLEGELTTIATSSVNPAKLHLEGQVGDWGAASIEGTVKPSTPEELTDITVTFRNIEFPDLSAYTIKFAGRRIAKGRLDLDLRYLIEDGRLNGENNIVIRELELGERVDYAGAMNLPLGLAVALLKDAEGKIDLDLPVRGDVYDPQFRIGGVIMQAFVNLITGIVTFPFRLLANLVGSDSPDFDQILFEPGQSALTAPEREKIAKLGEALAMRPILVLEVQGVVAPDVDAPSLARQGLDSEIEERVNLLQSSERNVLGTVLRRRVIEALFTEQMPSEPLKARQAGFKSPPEEGAVLDESAYLESLRADLIESRAPSGAELDQLAQDRASAILSLLLTDSQLARERVSVRGSVQVRAEGSGRVPLKLDVSIGEESPALNTN